MIRELITDTDILSLPCAKATADDAAVADDLLDTLAAHDDAAGLAANQIGKTVQIVAYLDDKDEPHVLFNPVVKRALYPFKAFESCLSRDDESKVTRFERVQVAYEELRDGALVARKAYFDGFPGQTIQHLIDHCNGKLV